MIGLLKFLNAIPKWFYAAVIAALAATSCKLKIDLSWFQLELEKSKVQVSQAEAETARTREEHLTLVASSQLATQKLEQVYRDKEQSLQQSMDDQRRKLNESNVAIIHDRDALRLRFTELQTSFAATISAGNTTHTAAHTDAGTPAANDNRTQLSDPIGDLIDEAARAETIRKALNQCYESYDSVRKAFGAPDSK